MQAALMSAREHLVAMVDAADAATQDQHYAEVTTASQALDEAIAAALADEATSAEDKAKVEDFKATWEAFKNTRETEIVPFVREGKAAEAKAIATGVQAERMAKMKSLLAELGAAQ
jgi:hypothetical protein